MLCATLKIISTAFLALTCAAVCAACSPRVERVVLAPPPALLEDCPHPPAPAGIVTDNVNAYAAAVTGYVNAYAARLDECNGSKAAMRQWYADMGVQK